MSKNIYYDRQKQLKQPQIKGKFNFDLLYSIAQSHLIIDEGKRQIKESETHKNYLDKVFLLKLRYSEGLKATVESGFNVKTGVIDFEIHVNKDYSRKYCEVSGSRIIQVEKCELYVTIFDTCHSELENIYSAIERCFTDFASVPIPHEALRPAREQADD